MGTLTKAVLFAVIVLFPGMMNAQSLISGCVKNGSGESVEGAIVTLFSLPDSSILSYQITGVDGKFTVSSGDTHPIV